MFQKIVAWLTGLTTAVSSTTSVLPQSSHPDRQWAQVSSLQQVDQSIHLNTFAPSPDQIEKRVKDFNSSFDLSFSDQLSNWIARTAGSWKFILAQTGFVIIWIIGNSYFLEPIDPPPFILLNLILSFQAEFSASFIIMSQRVGDSMDRMRALELETKVDQIYKLIQIQEQVLDRENIQNSNPESLWKRLPELELIELGLRNPSNFENDLEKQDLEALGPQSQVADHTMSCMGGLCKNLEKHIVSMGEKIADFTALHMRSWKYIAFLTCCFSTWMLVNIYMNPPYDPFPFPKLNLVLSTLAATNAPVIMMSANRQLTMDRVNHSILHLKVDAVHSRLKSKIKKKMYKLMRQFDAALTELEKKNQD